MGSFRAVSACLLCLLGTTSSPIAAQGPGGTPGAADSVRAHYRKMEVRIPMRDGITLFTSIYLPRDTTRDSPILMTRTPYSVAPYGPDAYRFSLGPAPRYMQEGLIFVYQDARGRHYSEGDFTEMRPHREVKRGPQDTDESTDSYDTIEWLLKNLPHNNGRVGIVGGSYPGFYTSASCIDAHPALKACSPQAPMTDVAAGDDIFHNGAFLLPHNFGFYLSFGRTPRADPPGPDPRYPFSMGTADAYQFYLAMGPVGPGSRRHLPPETAPLWTLVLEHPNYDAWWKARDLRPHLRNMKPAMLTVGGFYDTEDLAGPWLTYRAIEAQSPGADNRIVLGPWSHGGWGRGDGNVLGNLRWESKTGPFYRDSVEFPFFMHYLKDAPDPNLPDVLIFRTGADRWDRYDAWPPKQAAKRALYFHPGGKLSFVPAPTATGAAAYDAYLSDPARPVPLVDRIEGQGMPRDYITADQRFAARRPDVLVYQTEVLTEDVTLAGPVAPRLHVSTSGTDADFIVKLIDVFPDSAADWPGDQSGFKVGGYQQLVRGEPFRGKFRKSLETPVPFTPNVPDEIRFDMPDINHTFRKGHRIMVQIQSTWFPHIDRNPQTFVANIFEARPSDFRPATMRVYRSAAKPTRLDVLVLEAPR